MRIYIYNQTENDDNDSIIINDVIIPNQYIGIKKNIEILK